MIPTTDVFLNKVKCYYEEKITQWGPCARGVDWNGEESQNLRFKQFLRLNNPQVLQGTTINDLGCGYGAFAKYLDVRSFDCHYKGYDISPKNIRYAIQETKGLSHVKVDFCNDSKLQLADYTFASGIFNVRLEMSDEPWLDYILYTLQEIDTHSQSGWAFNLLSIFSDVEKRRPHLYYGDPMFFFERCKRDYAFNVALLHDYDLYEFTILVNKSRT